MRSVVAPGVSIEHGAALIAGGIYALLGKAGSTVRSFSGGLDVAPVAARRTRTAGASISLRF